MSVALISILVARRSIILREYSYRAKLQQDFDDSQRYARITSLTSV